MTLLEWLRQFIGQAPAPVYGGPVSRQRYGGAVAPGTPSAPPSGALASLARRTLPRTLGAGVHPDTLPGASYALGRTNNATAQPAWNAGPGTVGGKPVTGWIYTGTANLFGQQSPQYVLSHWGQGDNNILAISRLISEGWRPTV